MMNSFAPFSGGGGASGSGGAQTPAAETGEDAGDAGAEDCLTPSVFDISAV